jgi:hypothetical protein
MEDSRILNWQRWSLLRKAQVITTGFCAFLTILVWLGEVTHFDVPPGSIRDLLFGLWLLVWLPTTTLTTALGLESSGIGFWRFHFLGLAINSILGLGFGTIIGLLIAVLKCVVKRGRQ